MLIACVQSSHLGPREITTLHCQIKEHFNNLANQADTGMCNAQYLSPEAIAIRDPYRDVSQD